jgi:hypothetical protein
MYRNPSIIIRLPNFGPQKPVPVQKWKQSEIREIIDAEDFGEIREVVVRYDNHNEQFAVVHFERWFRGADETAEMLYRGGKIRIKAKYGKYFVLHMFRLNPIIAVSNKSQRPKQTANKLVSPRPRPEQPVPKHLPPQPQKYFEVTTREDGDIEMEEGEL